MTDDKFFLMKQCLKDALKIVREYIGEEYGSKGNRLDTNTAQSAIATALFAERSKHPISQEDLKRLIMSGEEAASATEELKGQYEELNNIMNRLQQAREELAEIKKKIVSQHSTNFLLETIGSENYHMLNDNGCIDIYAKNGGLYNITKQGGIKKLKRHRFREVWSEDWQGSIMNTHGLPMPDAIATIYAHILKNPNKFDKEKGCGNITIG